MEFPKKYGDGSIELETQDGDVRIVGAGFPIFAERVELEDCGVWFWKGGTVVGHVYMEKHIARRLGTWAEHAGVDVVGL